MENQQLASSPRQCSNTPVGLGQGFFNYEECDNTEAYPYSPDLASADFYVLRRLRSALMGRRFCDATDIIKYAMEKLKRLSQNVFR